MPHVFWMMLGLVFALFGAITFMVALHHLRLKTPEEDGYVRLQAGIARRLGMDKWADMQRGRGARLAGVAVSGIVVLAALCVSAWNAWHLLVGPVPNPAAGG